MQGVVHQEQGRCQGSPRAQKQKKSDDQNRREGSHTLKNYHLDGGVDKSGHLRATGLTDAFVEEGDVDITNCAQVNLPTCCGARCR